MQEASGCFALTISGWMWVSKADPRAHIHKLICAAARLVFNLDSPTLVCSSAPFTRCQELPASVSKHWYLRTVRLTDQVHVYIQDMDQPYVPAAHSPCIKLLAAPSQRAKHSTACWTFEVLPPRRWNELPNNIRTSESLHSPKHTSNHYTRTS